MLPVAGAWIAARLRRMGGALIAGCVILAAIILAVSGVRRRSYRKGKQDEQQADEIEDLTRAVKEGEQRDDIKDAMAKANARGPRTRDDVLKRLRDDD